MTDRTEQMKNWHGMNLDALREKLVSWDKRRSSAGLESNNLTERGNRTGEQQESRKGRYPWREKARNITEKERGERWPLDPTNINQQLASSWTVTLASVIQMAPHRSVYYMGAPTPVWLRAFSAWSCLNFVLHIRINFCLVQVLVSFLFLFSNFPKMQNVCMNVTLMSFSCDQWAPKLTLEKTHLSHTRPWRFILKD